MADKNSKEGLGISGFTLGILSIILAGYVGLFTSVIGFVFCFIQQKKNKTSLGKAGLILNVIGFVLSLIVIFYLAPMMSELLLGTT